MKMCGHRCESAGTGASLRMKGVRDQCESAGTGVSLRVRGVKLTAILVSAYCVLSFCVNK